MNGLKLLYFVTEDWYFCSHRLPLAIAARDAGYEVVVVTRVREHGEIIHQAGLKLVPFELSRRGMNPLAELSMFARLVAVYRREKPDLVHHVAMKPVLYGSLAARLAGVPCVINALAGLGWLFTSGSRHARLLRGPVAAALRMALGRTVTIVQNPDDQSALVSLGVPLDGIRMVRGSGVDTGVYAPGDEEDGIPLVVLPARMLWDKGVGEFVAAAEQLRAEGIAARFALVGAPDPMNPASVPVVQLLAWQTAGAVEWWGRRDDMPEVYRQAHLVCLPSYREGLPKSLIEAAACSRAIVTTDAPGCREIVRDGDNGLLVPLKDAPALANALRRLIMDGALRRRMGARSRQIAVDEFALERVISATLDVYQTCQN